MTIELEEAIQTYRRARQTQIHLEAERREATRALDAIHQRTHENRLRMESARAALDKLINGDNP